MASRNLSGRIALTFGDAGENHVGMEQLGNKGEEGSGFSVDDLKLLYDNSPGNSELIHMELEGYPEYASSVLIIRDYVDKITQKKLIEEMSSFEWDSKYYDTRRKKVLNKLARHNCMLVDGVSQEPDYENKKGLIINTLTLPTFTKTKKTLFDFVDTHLPQRKAKYICEGNHYYDLKKCGIGLHGDTERTRVLCISLGVDDYPMKWQWYLNSKPLEDCDYEVTLNSGDLYIMSEGAVGGNWKKRKFPTLRHAAGIKKYTDVKK